ncbi:MAG: T9SS type A sorting domain-containing protein [Bacteroidota bacterium]
MVDHFGRGIAIEDTTLVVSFGRKDPDTISEALIYYRKNGSWTLSDSLFASPTAYGTLYGRPIHLSGSRIATASQFPNAVDVFELVGEKWRRTATLGADDDIEMFDLRGDRILMSADRRNSDNAAAYLYEWAGTEWTRSVLKLPGSNDQPEGMAVLTDDGVFVFMSTALVDGYDALAEYVQQDSVWVLDKVVPIDRYRFYDAAFDSYGNTVVLTDAWRGEASVLPLDDIDSVRPFDLRTLSRETDQLFGDAISRDGNRVAVSALTATSVYVLGPDGPQLEGEVAGGNTVDLDGSRLVVGNQDNRSASTYELANGTWSSTGQLRGADSFGASVALDGNHLLVGTPGFGTARGTVDAYAFDGRVWQPTTRVVSPDSIGGDQFGASVALDDGLAVVGAPGRRRANNIYGDAYVYEASGDRWDLAAAMAPPANGRIGEFGRAVAVNGGRVLVAAPISLSRPSQSGTVYGYEGTTWRHTRTLIGPEDYTSFGSALALDGNRAAIGAPRTGPGNNGTAFVYVDDGQQWGLSRQLAPPEGKGGAFGRSVDLSGRSIAVGAPLDSEIGPFAGSAYLFEGVFPVDNTDAPLSESGLSAAFPNPTTQETHLTLSLDAPEQIHVEVFDALGRSVLPMRSHLYGSGTHTLRIESASLPPGAYRVRVTSSTLSETRTITRIR